MDARSSTDVCSARQYRVSASRGVPFYVPAITGIQSAYRWRDGQAELTWEASYTTRWFTHPQ